MADSDKDKKFAARIQSAIQTVEAWDDDPSLLAECRLMIPFALLMPELHGANEANGQEKEKSPYHTDKDYLYEGNVLFLKRLAVYFQKEVMTWVDQPPCRICQSTEHMEAQETRGPESQEEQEGQASRVEVYHCQTCSAATTEPVVTTFPRYNSVRKLLETRRGRCGEYANLFGLYCRATGFETRYVSDWTDHVWVEVWCGSEWVMADGCEGTIQEPSMYEHGWGKELMYMVAVQAGGGVTDVTPRYTRQFSTPAFQERRRQVTSSETVSDQIVRQYHDRMIQNNPSVSAKKKEELERRRNLEQAQLNQWKTTTEWTELEKHGQGRLSGSLEWRVQRNEIGNQQHNDQTKSKTMSVGALCVEQFYPTQSQITISIFPQQRAGIIVSGTNCDVGQPHSISLVVVDDVHLGCILQCRSFSLWSDLVSCLQTIPVGRIVVLKGVTKEETFPEGIATQMSDLLGGFQIPSKPSEGVMFLGRLESGGTPPDWTKCATYAKETDSSAIHVEFSSSNTTRSITQLRTEPNKVPRRIVGRLPESAMPLQTQLMASESQKRKAFLSYAKANSTITGYTTKSGSPIYVMNNASFPFLETQGDWKTFHFLPEVLVPAGDDDESDSNKDAPNFDVPLEEIFFTTLLGPSLLVKSTGGATVTLPLVDALRHRRLIALYFSGHWCGPCRRFTPMLTEAYEYLKETFEYHGIEVIFVSSDRSTTEFNQYYASMPWAAVPYDETRIRQQGISMQFGVRGIPAMVVLDAISGQTVASIEQARNEVGQACRRGDTGIVAMFQAWISRIPADSRELFDLMQLSAAEGATEDSASSLPLRDAYLTRSEAKLNPWSRSTTTVKDLGSSSSPTVKGTVETLAKGDDAKIILETLLKYLDNAIREPWNPKFRSFKMSNKIVDKAVRLPGSVELVCSVGLLVEPTAEDFMVSIPMGVDLDHLQSSMKKALAGHN